MNPAEVVNLILVYYRKPGNGAGGLCHVALDDGNLDDECLEFCLEECRKGNDADGEALMRTMKALPEFEREAVYESFHSRRFF
jgi:hypothetical protein